MSKNRLIAASVLILAGSLLFVGVMMVLGWDFSKLSTVDYETNEYAIDTAYENISVVTDTADVTLVLSQDTKSSVVCYEEKALKHTVSVENDTLFINLESTKQWYEYIGINFDTPQITLCIPQKSYGTLSIQTSTGDVRVADQLAFESVDITGSTGDVTSRASVSGLTKIAMSTGDIDISNAKLGALELSLSTGDMELSNVICEADAFLNVTTGDVEVSDFQCGSFFSSGSTGDIVLKNTIAAGSMSIQRTTGDIRFEQSDAAELYVKSGTGDVTGSLLSKKRFATESNTGDIAVSNSELGGHCEIVTNTGDIRINTP